MKKWFLIPLVFVWAGCSWLFPKSELAIDVDIEKHTLSNGLHVFLIPDPSASMVTYQTWVKVGSVDEKRGHTGIAHLFEHLMFKGTEKFGSRAFFKLLEAKGASVNAYTTRDYTQYYVDLAPDLLETVIEMEADRLQNLTVSEEEFQTERNVVLEERQLRVENVPSAKVDEALWLLSYGVHPYRNPVIGYPEDLFSIHLKDLKSFFKMYYQPGNVAVVVSGAIDTDKTLEWIEKYYEPIPGKKLGKRKIPSEPMQESERRLKMEESLATPLLARGYRAPRAGKKEAYALDLLALILFDGRNSRAHRALVEERSMCLAVSANSFTPTFEGMFSVYATLRDGVQVKTVEEQLDSLIEQVQSEGVSEEELSIAKRKTQVGFIEGISSPHGLAQFVGVVWAVLGDVDLMHSEVERYESVSREDIQKVAKKYLQPNGRSTVVAYPKNHAPKGVQF